MSVEDRGVLLRRHEDLVITHQRFFVASCRAVVPTPLVLRIFAQSRLEPVLFANLSDPFATDLVHQLSGSLVLLVDVRKPIPWPRIRVAVHLRKAVVAACDAECTTVLLRSVSKSYTCSDHLLAVHLWKKFLCQISS